MLRIGEYNTLIVDREKDFGFYLRDKQSREDVLLPKSLAEGMGIEVGKEVTVFIYRDSKDRPIATFKKPLATVGDVAYLKVVQQSEFGAFVDFGLDRDIFVKEQRYKLHTGKKYLFYIYVDKTGRLAATTEVEPYIEVAEEGTFKVGDEVTAMVFSKTLSGTLNVAINAKYRGLEYYNEVHPGYEMNLRVKRIYEDGVIGLTPRKTRLNERDELQEKIVAYMRKNGGFMEFNDKSNPEDIKAVFGTSKNYFKMALGGLMKAGKLTQDKEGSRLI